MNFFFRKSVFPSGREVDSPFFFHAECFPSFQDGGDLPSCGTDTFCYEDCSLANKRRFFSTSTRAPILLREAFLFRKTRRHRLSRIGTFFVFGLFPQNRGGSLYAISPKASCRLLFFFSFESNSFDHFPVLRPAEERPSLQARK